MSERAPSQLAQRLRASTPVVGGLLQRKCDCGSHTVAGGECEDCAKKKGGLQRKLTIGASSDSFEQEADRIADQALAAPTHHAVSGAPLRIQPYAMRETAKVDTAPGSVDRAVASSGRPLDSALRQDMEQRFGHDFSLVRVHSGEAAEQSARELDARAYTVGHDIVFGAGRFEPGGHEGRRLLAHELTHVVQQTGTGTIGPGQSNAPTRIQRAPNMPGGPTRRRGSALPYRESKNLLECIRIMGEKNAAYCRREVLGEEDVQGPSPSAPTPSVPSAPPVTFGSGKTARILRMETARNCAYTITYSNPREVDCDTAWRKKKKTAPPGPLCGTSLVYDITSVSAVGSKCPAKLDGLKLAEIVKGDHGCTTPDFVWDQGSCVIGPGGKLTGCTDEFTLCGLTSELKGDCTEFVDQEMEVGGQLAEEHEIKFDLKKGAKSCKGTVKRD